jgi:hypothetical protein
LLAATAKVPTVCGDVLEAVTAEVIVKRRGTLDITPELVSASLT